MLLKAKCIATKSTHINIINSCIDMISNSLLKSIVDIKKPYKNVKSPFLYKK